MTDRCEPPPEYRHLPWHWLRDENGDLFPSQWDDGEWYYCNGEIASPEHSYAIRDRYHAPAIPPEKPA